MQITIKNTSNEPRTVVAALTAFSIYYTGTNNTKIKKAEGEIKLGPKQEQVSAITPRLRKHRERSS